MNIGIAQLNTIVGDVQGNLAKGRAAYEQCVKNGANVVVLAELFTTGYPPKDLIRRRDLISANLEAVETINGWSKELGVPIIYGFIEPNPVDGEKDHFNAVMTAIDGKPANIRHKTLLPTYDVFNEDRYFQPGDVAKEFAPVNIGGVLCGVINCEEAWNDPSFWKERLYKINPVAEMVKNGAKMIIVVNASPFREGVFEKRVQMMAAHCKLHGVPCVYVNQVGYNEDVGFDGRSFAMNDKGEVTYLAAPFREEIAVVDPNDFPLPEKVLHIPWQQEMVLALTTGVRDYFGKLGINGPAVLGLSGGIDSALVAYIAAAALGKDRVVGVGMPSEYSSDHSKSDAEQLARKLGIHWALEPIRKPHNAVRDAANHIMDQLYSDVASQVGSDSVQLFGRPQVNIEDSGVTDENIQARARMLYLMTVSNFFNGVLLTTGNKSETAVGYCTLYGDMSGGLAVISDVLKTKVFEICRWINETSRDEIIPWNTINKPPSAELRPGQTDQQSLPPYEVLDEIIVGYVEDELAPSEIEKQMYSYDRAMKYNRDTGRDLVNDIYWVCQTTDRNEHKRKQSATGLKVSKKMFKMGREVPIVHKLPVRGVVKHGASPSFPLGGEKVEQ